MRIAFMGTPDFAVPALDALHDAGHEIACVYTQPPRPAGRVCCYNAGERGGGGMPSSGGRGGTGTGAGVESFTAVPEHGGEPFQEGVEGIVARGFRVVRDLASEACVQLPCPPRRSSRMTLHRFDSTPRGARRRRRQAMRRRRPHGAGDSKWRFFLAVAPPPQRPAWRGSPPNFLPPLRRPEASDAPGTCRERCARKCRHAITRRGPAEGPQRRSPVRVRLSRKKTYDGDVRRRRTPGKTCDGDKRVGKDVPRRRIQYDVSNDWTSIK